MADKNDLWNYVRACPAGEQPALPLVHVTPMSRFLRIAETGWLAPQYCTILRQNILYCSYGDIVFRPSGKQSAWDADPPVVLILSPKVLSRGFAFAPLDTGAIAAGRVPWFPNACRRSLQRAFCLPDRNGRMLGAWLANMFGDDQAYIERRIAPLHAGTPEEAVIVRQLAAAAANVAEPDHRRDDMRVISQIECHIPRPMHLQQSLLAAYLPSEIGRLRSHLAPALQQRVRVYAGHPVAGNLPKDLVTLVHAYIQEGVQPLGRS